MGNLVPSNVFQQRTVNGGSEQPENKAGKGDTIAVTTWAEKLLHGLRNTVVTTWASPSKNKLLLGPRFLPGLEHIDLLPPMGKPDDFEVTVSSKYANRL